MFVIEIVMDRADILVIACIPLFYLLLNKKDTRVFTQTQSAISYLY